MVEKKNNISSVVDKESKEQDATVLSKDKNNHKKSVSTEKDPTQKEKVTDKKLDDSESEEFFKSNGTTKSSFDRHYIEKSNSIIFPLTMAGFIISGILIAGYIYNIVGIRDIANGLVSKSDINSLIIRDSIKKNEPNIETISPAKEDLSAKKRKSSGGDTENGNFDKGKYYNKSKLISENDNIYLSNNMKFTFKDKVIKENRGINSDSVTEEAFTLNHNSLINYEKLKERLNEINSKIFNLSQKVESGSPYVKEIIKVKSFFPDLSIPTLTEYSTAGFPNDITIIQNGIDAIRYVTITSQNASDNKFKNLINQFVIITPKSREKGLDTRLIKLEKNLKDGDFVSFRKNLKYLSAREQEVFTTALKLIDDKKNIIDEIRLINSSITDILFSY